jgi:5-methylcytosine-specific restriction endonuclease McrA
MVDDETLYIDIYSSGEHRAYELFWVLRKHIEEINNEMLLNAEEYIMDGKADFLLEDVVAALETNGFVSRRGVRRNARELLGDFYDDSVIQSMRIEDGIINISIEKRKFTPCKKDNKALRLALYETYHHICPYCGNPLTYREMQVDHILPAHYPAPLVLKPYVDYLSTCNFNIDEPDYIENYFPSHGYCNRDKSNRVNEFTLPYWHLIAAQKAKTVIERKKRYEKQGVQDNSTVLLD